MTKNTTSSKHFAIIGAGMAGISCARALVQAGQRVTLFEKSRGLGGRMATRDSAFGSFDHGAQYFTARDKRFVQALEATPELCKRWSANSVQVLDELGHISAPGLTTGDAHWVGVPGMKSLAAGWAEPLKAAGLIQLQTRVMQIAPDALHAQQWQLHTEALDGSQHVFSGFDRVLLAIPSVQAHSLLQTSKQQAAWVEQIAQVKVAPCWTLMLAFPQAMQPGMNAFGPQWNAARSTHHRIAWLARESSKPKRDPIERWTVQASAAWSQEHLQDDPQRAQAKLLKAFTEVTGIHAEPAHVDSQRWLYAKTVQPLGQPYLWDAQTGLGVMGDWCIGHRVEDAFVSGLELALAAI
ncbi:FAD-dependent oxidoreductase [Rhodoferax sp.]|uniref:NAD(P)/FAD-dependent oxidoreductase n=2 Tax=Rhodoferax sp. TaxID=50421 RepID=UPI00262FC5E4|nr:FAD-dependent oxidoreductase [Rhodoferax sp.]MDD2808079.1 FAD-dependent oxidoreductase [Rhodoferax sp.]